MIYWGLSSSLNRHLLYTVPPKSYLTAPPPVQWYLEVGPAGGNQGLIRLWKWHLHDGISALIKGGRERDLFFSIVCASREGHVNTRQKGGHLQARKKILTRTGPHCISDVQPLELWEKKCLFLKPHTIYSIFVTATQAQLAFMPVNGLFMQTQPIKRLLQNSEYIHLVYLNVFSHPYFCQHTGKQQGVLASSGFSCQICLIM